MPPRRSDHFDGRRFHSPGAPPIATWKRVLRWWFSRRDRGHWPKIVPVHPAAPPPSPAPGRCALTWVNHSTFLLQTPSGNFITDPVYSRRAGPFGIVGPRRVHEPGVPLASLPTIHCVLLSHDHYDHCDIAALRQIASRDKPAAITPLNNGPLLRRAGFRDITELDWWEHAVAPSPSKLPEKPPATVTATPARHWSNRLSGARNSRLWSGFWLELPGLDDSTPARTLYFAGDTGYNPAIFHEIHSRLGAPDIALLPIGAYHPRWFMRPQHCDPVEAVQIHLNLHARQSYAMHWGCFRLTDEERDAPCRELAEAVAAAALPPSCFLPFRPGQTVEF
jgi:L-ascorbate metabolism protein UlaG (beta-lactamase superfamily)